MNDQDARKVGEEIWKKLEDAWNAADGKAFGEPFAEDADFVDIRGDHHRGQRAIAGGHQAILDSIYKGSTVKYELDGARVLSPDVLVVHARATLECPAGPMAGTNNAMMTSVLAKSGAAWKIAAFHNTVMAKRGG